MTEMDISRLSAGERLDLIGRLWDSLETDDIALTPAQRVELDRRLETADADLATSIPWDALRAELAIRRK
jgi:putative addiction module component (TIGR02574 family)